MLSDGRDGVVETGLLGAGIDRSVAPLFHELLGRLSARPVIYRSYDVDPAIDVGSFLAHLRAGGMAGINVTRPFKEAVVEHVVVDDRTVALIAAVNRPRPPVRPGPSQGRGAGCGRSRRDRGSGRGGVIG